MIHELCVLYSNSQTKTYNLFSLPLPTDLPTVGMAGRLFPDPYSLFPLPYFPHFSLHLSTKFIKNVFQQDQ
jgi:hypothetical protein